MDKSEYSYSFRCDETIVSVNSCPLRQLVHSALSANLQNENRPLPLCPLVTGVLFAFFLESKNCPKVSSTSLKSMPVPSSIISIDDIPLRPFGTTVILTFVASASKAFQIYSEIAFSTVSFSNWLLILLSEFFVCFFE